MIVCDMIKDIHVNIIGKHSNTFVTRTEPPCLESCYVLTKKKQKKK